MKVVINTRPGGFGLSSKALLRLYELGANVAIPVEDYFRQQICELTNSLQMWRDYLRTGECEALMFLTTFSPDEKFVLTERFTLKFTNPIERTDKLLIQVVYELGEEANSDYSRLKIVEIPDFIKWHISEREDGTEYIAEDHQVWE